MSNHDSTGFQSDNPQAPVQDRGLFDCFGKKEETEDVPMTEAEHKPSLMEKLHRSNSSSSSSSEEEVEEDGVKIRRRKKKGLTDKVKEKLHGHNNEGAPEGIHPEEKKGFIEKIKEKMPGHHTDEVVIAPAPAQAPAPAPPHCQPGGHCGGTHGAHHKEEASIAPHLAPTPSPAHATAPTPPHCHPGGQCGVVHEPHESQEKKGIIEKIMDMLPGGNKDGGEAKKDY